MFLRATLEMESGDLAISKKDLELRSSLLLDAYQYVTSVTYCQYKKPCVFSLCVCYFVFMFVVSFTTAIAVVKRE